MLRGSRAGGPLDFSGFGVGWLAEDLTNPSLDTVPILRIS